MKFKTNDLLITILPKKTIIADEASGDDGDVCPELPTCGPTRQGQAGPCHLVTLFPTCQVTRQGMGQVWLSNCDEVEAHRRELQRHLEELEAYQKAQGEEGSGPSEAQFKQAIETLEDKEAKLEAALDGIRALKKELENQRSQPDEE